MPSSYLKVPTEIFDHPLWTEQPYTAGQAFIDLYALAVDRDTTYQGVEVKRGQYFTSIRRLKERWKRGHQKVREYLDLLSLNGLISQEHLEQGLRITITDYDLERFAKNWSGGPRPWWEPPAEPKLYEPPTDATDHPAAGRARPEHPPCSAEHGGVLTASTQKYLSYEILIGDDMNQIVLERVIVTPADMAKHRETLNRIAAAVGGVHHLADRRYLVRVVVAADRWLGAAWRDQPLVDLEEIANRGKTISNRFQWCRDRWESSAYRIYKKPLATALSMITVDPGLLARARNIDDVAQI